MAFFAGSGELAATVQRIASTIKGSTHTWILSTATYTSVPATFTSLLDVPHVQSLVHSTQPSGPYFSESQSLAFLKWPLPRNPLFALNGEGC